MRWLWSDLMSAAATPPAEDRFPTRRPAPEPAPAPPPVAGMVIPDPLPACRALGTSSYRYSSHGRRLRTGGWKDGVLLSTIDEFAAARPAGEPAATHLKRGARPWNQLGALRGEDEKIVAALRAAQAPHLQLALALQAVRGDPLVRTESLREGEAWVYRWDFNPARIRAEVDALLDRAADEERLDRPREILWTTLEGSLEVAVGKLAPQVLRVVDRRKVAYLPAAPSAPRTTYQADTVTTFFDHGRTTLLLPPELARPAK